MSRAAKKKRDPLRVTRADVKLLTQYAIDNAVREQDFDEAIVKLLMSTRNPDPDEFKRLLDGRALCRAEAQSAASRVREIRLLWRIEADAEKQRAERAAKKQQKGGAS